MKSRRTPGVPPRLQTLHKPSQREICGATEQFHRLSDDALPLKMARINRRCAHALRLFILTLPKSAALHQTIAPTKSARINNGMDG